MQRRQAIEEVLSDSSVPPDLKRRLRLVQQARQFATDELLLPDNDSYRSYADVDRDYVVWNVFAAPEFSLEARSWCFPVAGCVAYRGYFSRKAAEAEAARLGEKGYDVSVLGVAAYSTLGRFADPVLNTMLQWSDTQLVATLFHELAHQVLYVRDDSRFNESFATALADIGMQRWLAGRGGESALRAYRAALRLQDRVLEEVDRTRERLAALYAGGQPASAMRIRKQALYRRLAEALRGLRSADGPGDPGRRFTPPRNNADLVSLALYTGWTDAFRRVYDECGQALECFYRRTRDLAELPADERTARLIRLTEL